MGHPGGVVICDEGGLTFYLGTHREGWLGTAPPDVALDWRDRLLRTVESAVWQPDLFEAS